MKCWMTIIRNGVYNGIKGSVLVMYQLLRGTLIGVVSLGLFAVDTTTSVSASSHTSPTSLRGTWYHYFTKMIRQMAVQNFVKRTL